MMSDLVAQGANLEPLTWTLPHAVAGTMVLSLNAYVLLAGADFGGGVWDMFAVGREREEQRAIIEDAIGPIWEANHVWLILVVVLLFTCFPRAFAHLATELHVPITLLLVGIVLRGSAFTFRKYDSHRDAVQLRWGRIFSIASFVTPMLLGLCLGTVASGRVGFGRNRANLTFGERFVEPWLTSPFGWAVALLTLSLFAFLAATYLTVEAEHSSLSRDFRRRALQSQFGFLAAVGVTMWMAQASAPTLHAGLTSGVLAVLMLSATGAAIVVAVFSLATERYRMARFAAAAQATFVLWGWAWSQFPFLIPPDGRIDALAASPAMLKLNLITLAIGTVILLPGFAYLFWIFKRKDVISSPEREQ